MRRENIFNSFWHWSAHYFCLSKISLSMNYHLKEGSRSFPQKVVFSIRIRAFLAFLVTECSFLSICSFVIFLLSYAGSFENAVILLCTFKISQKSDHFMIHTNIKSLYHIPEINIMLYVNYTSLKVKSQSRKKTY